MDPCWEGAFRQSQAPALGSQPLPLTREGSIMESRPGAEEGVDGKFGVPITDSPPPAPSSRMPPRIALASLLGQAANLH